MNATPMNDQVKAQILEFLKDAALFKSLPPQHLETILKYAEPNAYQPGDTILERQQDSEHFLLIYKGEASVFTQTEQGERKLLTTLGPGGTIGEIGALLNKGATVTVTANGHVRVLKFPKQLFFNMFSKVPNFGLAIAQNLAARLEEVSGQVSLPQFRPSEETEQSAPRRGGRVTDLLPLPFMQRHRVLPVRQNGNLLTVGFVDDPSAEVLDSLYRHLPGMEIQPVRIHADYFSGVLRTRLGVDHWAPTGQTQQTADRAPKLDAKINALLERMVAEGASDLHLAEGEPPFWRIDGDLYPIEDAAPLEPGELRKIFEPALEARHRQELQQHHDTDFGCTLPGLARFRVNLFQDAHGASASVRQLPVNILQLDHLSHADTFKRFCEVRNGLILVTGPTGSGKSTTLAAMVDHINKNFARHIITLEDPIEYVHKTRLSFVNQREIGGHTPSFQRGIRSALREDPDVILVGEILDLETMNLVLEAASTGHLVLSTMHTNSAAAAVDRIVDMYPAAQQPHVRSSISEILKGVVCQTLCKRVGGGRVAAFEVLVVTRPIASLIRENKALQIISMMQTGKRDGHVLMNDSLAALVREGRVAGEEAVLKSPDQADMANRLKR